MDIKDLTVEQLKAMAYDEGKKMNIAQNNLQVLNTRIVELEQPAPTKVEPCPESNQKDA